MKYTNESHEVQSTYFKCIVIEITWWLLYHGQSINGPILYSWRPQPTSSCCCFLLFPCSTLREDSLFYLGTSQILHYLPALRQISICFINWLFVRTHMATSQINRREILSSITQIPHWYEILVLSIETKKWVWVCKLTWTSYIIMASSTTYNIRLDHLLWIVPWTGIAWVNAFCQGTVCCSPRSHGNH